MATSRSDAQAQIDVRSDGTEFKIDGVGVTATADELNALADTGLSQEELDFLDGVTAGTATASKAVVLSTTKLIDEMGITTELVRAHNATGSTISKGAIVSFVGVHTDGLPKIVLADANAANLKAQGAAQADILTAAAGMVITKGLSPATLDTSASSATDAPAYLSETAGGVAYSEETESDEISQVIGYVVVDHASTGQLYYNFDKYKKIGSNELQNDAVGNAQLGPQAKKSYRFVYDFGVLGGAQGAITLTASNGQLPDNLVITNAWVESTTAAGTAAGTAALQLGITGNVDLFNDDNHDAGPYTGSDLITAVADELPVKLSAATDVLLTVGTADLNAGVFALWVEGYEGA